MRRRFSVDKLVDICCYVLVAECYDCATDSSCIQCMECFKGSNHEGHKVVIKKAYGGCCDCGDAEAWKKEGFCKRHTGEAM